MKLITLNIPRNITAEVLTELFSKHGKAGKFDLVMDKEKNSSKGFGFIEMENPEEAQAAITALHGLQLGNQKIRVKIAEERKATD